MDAQVAELSRLIENLLRFGKIEEVEGEFVRVRSGKNLTNWIRWITLRAGTTVTWDQPTVGEQVMLLSPGGDLSNAVALLSVYSDAHPAPTTEPHLHVKRYPDGATIQYDHEHHALTAILPAGGTALLVAPTSVTVQSDSVTLDALETTCTGNLTVLQRLTYMGGMSGQGGTGAAAQIEGEIHATGDVKAGNISLQEHTHNGVQSGGSNTGGPQ